MEGRSWGQRNLASLALDTFVHLSEPQSSLGSEQEVNIYISLQLQVGSKPFARTFQVVKGMWPTARSKNQGHLAYGQTCNTNIKLQVLPRRASGSDRQGPISSLLSSSGHLGLRVNRYPCPVMPLWYSLQPHCQGGGAPGHWCHCLPLHTLWISFLRKLK
jgi:hypothetical protein